MFEERIRHHFDFMKTHTLVKFSQSRGQSRGNKVHGVPTLRQFFAQLRTDYAAAAIGWIDCDADVHGNSEQYAVSSEQEANRSDKWAVGCAPRMNHVVLLIRTVGVVAISRLNCALPTN